MSCVRQPIDAWKKIFSAWLGESNLQRNEKKRERTQFFCCEMKWKWLKRERKPSVDILCVLVYYFSLLTILSRFCMVKCKESENKKNMYFLQDRTNRFHAKMYDDYFNHWIIIITISIHFISLEWVYAASSASRISSILIIIKIHISSFHFLFFFSACCLLCCIAGGTSRSRGTSTIVLLRGNDCRRQEEKKNNKKKHSAKSDVLLLQKKVLQLQCFTSFTRTNWIWMVLRLYISTSIARHVTIL